MYHCNGAATKTKNKMRKLASKNIQGQLVEVYERLEKRHDNTGKGPVNYSSYSFYWFVNGEYVETFSWHPKKIRQEMLINQFVDTHKSLFN